MRAGLFFGARSSRGTKTLKTADLWPNAKGLQPLRLGAGSGWGLEGRFAAGIPAEDRRRFGPHGSP